MEVILTQDVEGIGKAQEIVKVKDGFARNFLFVKNLAVPVTSANIQNLKDKQQRKSEQQEKEKKQALGLKEKLAALSLTLPVLIQEKEKLYGSISALEVQRALKDEGFEIDKAAIELPEPIKALGIYQVPVKLHPDVMAQVKVWVVKK